MYIVCSLCAVLNDLQCILDCNTLTFRTAFTLNLQPVSTGNETCNGNDLIFHPADWRAEVCSHCWMRSVFFFADPTALSLGMGSIGKHYWLSADLILVDIKEMGVATGNGANSWETSL